MTELWQPVTIAISARCVFGAKQRVIRVMSVQPALPPSQLRRSSAMLPCWQRRPGLHRPELRMAKLRLAMHLLPEGACQHHPRLKDCYPCCQTLVLATQLQLQGKCWSCNARIIAYISHMHSLSMRHLQCSFWYLWQASVFSNAG